MSDIVQFVDSISATPAVRLDLNNEAPWALKYEGTDMSPPDLRRGIAQTLLSHGGIVTAAAYDLRMIRLRLELADTTVDSVASRIQALNRELDRPTNLLRWQPGTSQPVFFRTMRSPVNKVTEVPGPGTFKLVDVDVLAEPFAYGLRENLPSVTVSADPAAGSNGCFFDVSSVKGDVETPLFLSVPGTDLVTSAPESSRVTAIAVRRRGTPSGAPFVLQAEAMAMGTDTTVQANSALMSGAGANWTRTTFATSAAMTARLSINPWPAVASVDVRGQYRVFMRYRSSIITPGVMRARLLWGTGNAFIANDSVDLIKAYGGAGGPYILYADLGIVQFPQGYDPVADGPDGVELPVEGMALQVEATRVSGTAALDIDCLLFVPADDRLLLATWPASPTLPATLTLDSDRGQVYVEGSSGLTGRTGAQLSGAPPMVSPAAANRITFVRDVGMTSSTGSGALGDEITATTVVSPYYWPRYLYVRPATS